MTHAPDSTAPGEGAAPPGPRSRYPGQLVRLLATDRLALFAAMARSGDVSQIRPVNRRVVLLSHPDDIRRMLVTEQKSFAKGPVLRRASPLLGEGLLTSDGATHLRQRRLMQPAFHRERLAAYADVMTAYGADAAARWREGDVVDLHDAMMRLTLRIAARTLFDVDVERDRDEIARTLDLSLRMFGYSMLPFGYLMEHVPLGWVRDLRRARARMDRIIYRIIAERRATGTDHGDLLSMLVAARDEGEEDEAGDGTGMTDRQLRAEVVTLLMAGHETTANALTWAFHLLSETPAAERALHAELDAVLGAAPDDGGPTIDDLPRLRYTRAVFAESLRLRPPAWIVERLALEDFEAQGYTIRCGALVLACQYLVHRDPRWWPDAEHFLPERWLGEDTASDGSPRPKMAYFPFGGGTRICIGEQFAWMEGTLVLAAIARRWRLRYAAATPPVPVPLITLRPGGGMPMVLERRTPGGRV